MPTALSVFLYVYVFLAGSVLGSFLNVVIYRAPRGLSFAKGRSFCPARGHTLSAADLVPFFSWLFLGRRCRYCGAPISARYPLVELLGGVLAVLCCLHDGFTWRALAAFAVFAVILCISFIDCDTMEIGDGFLLLLAALVLAGSLLAPETGWWTRAIGFFAISLPMFLLTLLIPDCFGGGDIKFIAVCGFWLGWKLALVAMFAAILAGGLWGIWLLASKNASRKSHFAFGPFLGAGVAAAYLWGDAVLRFYLNFFQ